MTTESRSTADLLLESLKARRKHHRTQLVINRVVRIAANIDKISIHNDRSALAQLVEYFMEGITTWFPDEPAKRLLWLLGAELEIEKLPSVEAEYWLNIYRNNDALPENRNPEVDSIVLHFRGPVGLEGCWLGDIDSFNDLGVRVFRSFLYGIENVIAADTCEMHEMFYFINKNILDIADALVATEDEDDVDLDGQAQ